MEFKDVDDSDENLQEDSVSQHAYVRQNGRFHVQLFVPDDVSWQTYRYTDGRTHATNDSIAPFNSIERHTNKKTKVYFASIILFQLFTETGSWTQFLSMFTYFHNLNLYVIVWTQMYANPYPLKSYNTAIRFIIVKLVKIQSLRLERWFSAETVVTGTLHPGRWLGHRRHREAFESPSSLYPTRRPCSLWRRSARMERNGQVPLDVKLSWTAFNFKMVAGAFG